MFTDDETRLKSDTGDTRRIVNQEDVALAVHAFIAADRHAREGDQMAMQERQQHLKKIQSRYWRIFYSLLSASLTRKRGAAEAPEFMDDARLCLDLGLVDPRMLGGNRADTTKQLMRELTAKGPAGCYYMTEWLLYRFQQAQLEKTLNEKAEIDDSYVSKLRETRSRVLDRMTDYLTGLPGIPLEVSESMRSGDLDNAILATGINLLRDPRRQLFLRRRNLWLLREQILAKARARVRNEGALRLFDLLNEVYVRDWRERYDAFTHDGAAEQAANQIHTDSTETMGNSSIDAVMDEARQINMRILLERAVDGELSPDIVLHNSAPRLTKPGLAEFLPLAQSFDRSLSELPPIIIVPGLGRGFFTWETGCAIVSVRPLVGTDDSVATAFAWQHMLDDHLNGNGELRKAFQKRFPGGVFRIDFPADYRAWMCRMTKGDDKAMPPDRRAFFYDFIGPELTKPLLPPNLRNIGPQTVATICRRLEKQLAAGEDDANLHRRLAALYWHQDNPEAAGVQFTAAMHSAPNDGETLFSAGMLMRSRGATEAANECFRFGAERAANTMWGIYCKDALANLF